MKKFFKGIIFVIVAIASIFAIVSCGSGKIDMDEVAKTLSHNGYTVGDEWVDDDPSVTRDMFIIDSETFYIVCRIKSYNSNTMAKIEYVALREQYNSNINECKNRIDKYSEMLNDSTLHLTEEQRDHFELLLNQNKKSLEILQKTKIGRTGNVVWYCSDEKIFDLVLD